jgi:hydrogenase maturation protease
MNLQRADQIAKAVLYEGYMLYPYRPSSVKNRQRWNFGVLHPQQYCEVQAGSDACSMRIECLVRGSSVTKLETRLRFLQLQERTTSQCDLRWQEAVERDISIPVFTTETALFGTVTQSFEFPAETLASNEQNSTGEAVCHRYAVRGESAITVREIREGLFKVRIDVRNTIAMANVQPSRDDALLQSMVSTHVVMGTEGGEFISLLEPPEEFSQSAAECENAGAWPVLVGEPGQHDTLLASPIILYDYPQIAPESAGDLFDGTEIDEILSLRIMTLTDDEKREIRESDERARQILERTDSLPAEQFMKLHGAMRSLRTLKESLP